MGRNNKGVRGSNRARAVQRQMVRSLDELDAILEFRDSILPNLRKDLKAGLTHEEIYAKYKHLAAARAVTIAVSEVDSSKALSACKEILDRDSGKATERKEVKHKYERMEDKDLDAIIFSKVSELEDEDTEKH